MNRLRDISPRRVLAFMAMLFGAMVTTMTLPAYGQQDVDPTWYDPYAVHTAPIAAPHALAAHSYQPPVEIREHQPVLTSVSLVQGTAKFRAKQSTAAPKIQAVTALRDPKPEAELQQIARRRDPSD